MAKVGCIVAAATDPDIFFGICNCQKTAFATGVTREAIAAFHKALLGEFRDAVGAHGISLHFRLYLAPLSISSQHHRYS